MSIVTVKTAGVTENINRCLVPVSHYTYMNTIYNRERMPHMGEVKKDTEKQLIRKVDEISGSLNDYKERIKLKEVKETNQNALIYEFSVKNRVIREK